MMSDDLKDLVGSAVSAMRKGPSKEVLESLAALAKQNPETLLPELFLQVEEAARGVDLKRLQPTELVPGVRWARKVILAVVRQKLRLLRRVVKGGYPDLVVALVSVIAALQESTDASPGEALPQAI